VTGFLAAALLCAPAPVRGAQLLKAPGVVAVPAEVGAEATLDPAVRLDAAAGAPRPPAAIAAAQEPALAASVLAPSASPQDAGRIERGLRKGPWAISADEERRHRDAVLQARAELDALFIGRGPAAAAPPPTLAERLAAPLSGRPSAAWRASGWVRKSAKGWAVIVPGAAPLAVARWSREGNPIVLVPPRGGGVVVLPTQHDLPGLSKYRGYGEGGRMTRLTRRRPLNAFYDPSQAEPAIVLRDGHHRFHVAERSGQPVYIELSGVRKPFDCEMREGRWAGGRLF